MKKIKAYSLIEMLVVLAVFAVLAIVVTQTMSSSLRGSKKSESQGKVRENVEYAMNVIERNLRNSLLISCSSVINESTLSYTNNEGNFYFKMVCPSTTSGYIEWKTAGSKLTNSDVIIIDCGVNSSFTCHPNGINPDSVDVKISAKAANSEDALGSTYSSQTTIVLRNN